MRGRWAQALRHVEAADVIAVLPRLRRYARVLTGDEARADELVVETLSRAGRRRRLWAGESNVHHWLFGVMRCVHDRQLARENGEIRTPFGASTDRQANLDPSIRSTGTEPANADDMRAQVARLPVDEREVLMLVAVERMTYDEIAALLGVPVATVVSTLTRARKHIGAID